MRGISRFKPDLAPDTLIRRSLIAVVSVSVWCCRDGRPLEDSIARVRGRLAVIKMTCEEGYREERRNSLRAEPPNRHSALALSACNIRPRASAHEKTGCYSVLGQDQRMSESRCKSGHPRNCRLGLRNCRFRKVRMRVIHRGDSNPSIANESGNARHTSPAPCKILVNGLNGGCPLSHGSRHSLDGATPHVTGGKDTGPACL
jgi:hypothetical protein